MKEYEDKRSGDVQRENRGEDEAITQEQQEALADIFLLKLLKVLQEESEGDIHILSSDPNEGIIFPENP